MKRFPLAQEKMYVVKRDGSKAPVDFNKITLRLENLCTGLDAAFIDPNKVALKVIRGLFCGVTTRQLDDLSAETAATMITEHADYGILAARLVISNLHKETKDSFSDTMADLYAVRSPHTNQNTPMISKYHYDIVREHKDLIDATIDYNRDYNFNYFGLKTLERSYLLRIGDKVVERPQHLYMRVALGIHGRDLKAAFETYNFISQGYFTHASPTLFAAATLRPQLSSCFLLTVQDDSIEGIFKTLSQCAVISKYAGGVGLNVHAVRSKGSFIAGTNGKANGLVPMLRVFNNTARFVDQGGNKRPGAFAIYLEPWHADIRDFLMLKRNTGNEELRARDLFYALWVPDLFMKRTKNDGVWSLMCPHDCPGLDAVYGEQFEQLYTQYEREGRYKEQVSARALWNEILASQIETGTPYILYKDACNRKSNHKNIGTIKGSNLCTEIVQYTAPDEVAVCNLASLALPKFVGSKPSGRKTFDFAQLKKITGICVRNLNKIIDINFYPVPEAESSNKRHRPIGIGVQGLADAFILMRLPFESPEAQLLNRQIFETIYYGALEASCDLAQEHEPYATYEGSPVSQGILQYDMWDVQPTDLWDWVALKKRIAIYGVRNSLLVAPMPTASTAQILGNNESFEPYTSNIYTRRVLSGEFQVVNQHLLRDLTRLNLWNDDMKNFIVANNGSIQGIDTIPADIQALYKTVWEISQKTLVDMAADRGAFIDQSQSFNVHMPAPCIAKLTSMHFYGWSRGLKTGMYYLRSKPAANAIQFTVDKQRLVKMIENLRESEETCSRTNDECLMCGA